MLSWKLQTYRYLTEKKKEKKNMDYKNTGIRFCNVSIRDSFCVFSWIFFFNHNEHGSGNLKPLSLFVDQFHFSAGQSTSEEESTLICYIHNVSPLKMCFLQHSKDSYHQHRTMSCIWKNTGWLVSWLQGH